jgi:hypothetical protein
MPFDHQHRTKSQCLILILQGKETVMTHVSLYYDKCGALINWAAGINSLYSAYYMEDDVL